MDWSIVWCGEQNTFLKKKEKHLKNKLEKTSHAQAIVQQ